MISDRDRAQALARSLFHEKCEAVVAYCSSDGLALRTPESCLQHCRLCSRQLTEVNLPDITRRIFDPDSLIVDFGYNAFDGVAFLVFEFDL